MLKRLFLIPLFILFVLVAISIVTAQSSEDDGCPQLVETALETTDELCQDTERNQACYGNLRINATARTEANRFVFETAGDKAELASIQSLELSGLDIETEEWGISLLRAQANLPDTLPGQNVTFLLFGDTQIEDVSDQLVEETMTINSGVNVRLTPTNRGTLLGSLPSGATVKASGRYTNQAGETWVRIRYAVRDKLTGWVIAENVDGDIENLPEVDATSKIYNPMQAFYFTTGIGESACTDAPPDGLVIQTPGGAGRVSFVANGVEVSLGSTAFLQASTLNGLCAYQLTGQGVVTSSSVSQYLLPGMSSCTPLNEEGWADGAPQYPQAYNLDHVSGLENILKILPDPVEQIPPPRNPSTRTPTNTPIPPTQTATNIPPTFIPDATSTSVPPTNTAIPPTIEPPTFTPIPPTVVPPTDTPIPIPPTDTPTPVPATALPCAPDLLTPATVNFQNTSTFLYLKIFALDALCTQGALYTQVNPGQSLVVNTFAGEHLLVVIFDAGSGSNTVHGEFVVPSGGSHNYAAP